MGVIDSINLSIASGYSSLMASVPSWAQQIINLFLLILVIVIYATFIWKFYRFIANKNLIELNLKRYNRSEHPLLSKFLGVVLYFIEYIIILPFLVFIWFAIFTIFLILLTESLNVQKIIILSATIIGAIRLISYIPRYGQNLAKEVAKLLPFTLLAISMTKPEAFDFQRIISQLTQIPEFFGQITLYVLFIFFLETVLRILDFILSLLGLKDPDPTEGEEED